MSIEDELIKGRKLSVHSAFEYKLFHITNGGCTLYLSDCLYGPNFCDSSCTNYTPEKTATVILKEKEKQYDVVSGSPREIQRLEEILRKKGYLRVEIDIEALRLKLKSDKEILQFQTNSINNFLIALDF